MKDDIRKRIVLTAFTVIFGGLISSAANLNKPLCPSVCSNNERIWANKPGDPKKNWEGQVFHLGNGYFGVSCDGGIEKEVFTLGEKSFWTGGPGDGPSNDYGIIKRDLHDLDLLKRYTAAGDFGKSDQATGRLLLSQWNSFGALSSIGNFFIHFKKESGKISAYERSLDLASSIATVSYNANGIHFKREYFCSYPDRVFAVRITSDKPDAVNFDLGINLLHKVRKPQIKASAADGMLRVTGNIDDNNRPYEILIKVVTDGGQLQEAGSLLKAVGCKSVVVYYTVATNYRMKPPLYKGADPKAITRDVIRRVMAQGYARTREKHIADYRELYSRTEFHLDNEVKERELLPTAERLNCFIAKKDFRDLGLKELAFNFGKYILISSSRPGALPASLMGCWNNRYRARWSGVYQLNMNVTQTYMFGNALNLPECQQSFIDYIKDKTYGGKKAAKAYYGLDDAWGSFMCGNIWGHVGILPSMEHKFVSTGWLSVIMWEQYAFERNLDYLKEIYPLLKGAAQFYRHNLVEYKDTGKLVFVSGASSEHNSPIGATVPGFQDIAFVQETFDNAIEASKILNVDQPFREELQKVKERLMPYKIGHFGQFQEWVEDIDDPNCKHRHMSQLMCLLPCKQLNPYQYPDLATAAKVAMNCRGDADLKALNGIGSNSDKYPSKCTHEGMHFDNFTAQVWCRAARMCNWIRLLDGNRADKIYNDILSESTLENMMQFETMAHYYYCGETQSTPFFLDGTVLSAGYVTEMVLQSEYGFLDFLPALPSAWKTGSLKGIRARGGFTVDVAWKDGKLTEAVIRCDQQSAPCKIHYDGQYYTETIFRDKPYIFRPSVAPKQNDHCRVPSSVIRASDAVSSSNFGPESPSLLVIQPSAINEKGEHVAKKWGNCWLSGDQGETGNNWVYIDLGAEYDLETISLWNYHDFEERSNQDVNLRGVKDCTLWVAPAGAKLPLPGKAVLVNGTVFAEEEGWNKIWGGKIPVAPPSTLKSSLMPPSKRISVGGKKKIQYIGVDIDSRYGTDPFTQSAVGLAAIQATGWGYGANTPSPVDGEREASEKTELTWEKSPFAATPDSYDLFLSKNAQAVKNGDVSARVTNQDRDGDPKNCKFVPRKSFENGEKYYWRVDSIANGERVRGPVWTFTVPLSLDHLDFEEILFVRRMPYSSDHNYSKAFNGTSANRFNPLNGIYSYNLKTKKVRPVITAQSLPRGEGVIGKFSLSYDAKKVVFDFRPNINAAFRIWEVNVDGTNLRQLSHAPADEAEKVKRYGPEFLEDFYMPNWGKSKIFHTDDLQPCYLPDGDIVFTSSRCEHGILCFWQPCVVALVLHRMDANGNNVRQLSENLISEFSPYVMDNGKILYHRWEYIDKGARVVKSFWEMNPDGSKSAELFGLANSFVATGAFMYGMPMPGKPSMLVCAVGPHYPQGNSAGPIKLIDLSKNNRSNDPLTNITPGIEVAPGQGGWVFTSPDGKKTISGNGVGGLLYTHPYPIDSNRILVAHKDSPTTGFADAGSYAIYLLNLKGQKRLIYKDVEGGLSCWHPTPLRARRVPRIIPSTLNPKLAKEKLAECVVINVYKGLGNVKPGTVKYLRINEAIPQYWATHRMWRPAYHSASWTAALWPRVQWGIIPVEKDGSARFYVPANRNIFFQALDENYMEVQRERTSVNYKPGEIRSCLGCHERSTDSSDNTMAEGLPLALRHPALMPQAQPGENDPRQVIDYTHDIQPIFDAKCVSCHGGSAPKAGLNLSGALTTNHNVSFEQLRNKGLAGPIISEFIHFSGADHANINGSYLPPMSLGSHKSKLISVLRTTDKKSPHYKRLTWEEQLKIIRWVDSNYQFYGSYYGRHHAAHKDCPDFRRKPTFEEAISPIAPSWHK